jgi:hypothetical protein
MRRRGNVFATMACRKRRSLAQLWLFGAGDEIVMFGTTVRAQAIHDNCVSVALPCPATMEATMGATMGWGVGQPAWCISTTRTRPWW